MTDRSNSHHTERQGTMCARSSAGSESAARWPAPGDRMRFLGANGYPEQLKRALKTFEVGAEYEVEACDVGDWSHSIRFKGVEGWHNGVMFDRVLVPTSAQPTPGMFPLFKREPREGSYFFVTAPAFPGWSYMLSPIENESRMKLSFVAFLEAEADAALAAQPPAAPVHQEDACAAAAKEYNAEHFPSSAATEGETKTVYVKRWRTLVKLPAKYADEIVAALRVPDESQAAPVLPRELVETACAAYAKATDYYVEFHLGLSSESSDRMRKGMRAALAPVIENCAKVCDDVVARAERLMDDPKASRETLAAVANGAMECAENIRASSPLPRPDRS